MKSKTKKIIISFSTLIVILLAGAGIFAYNLFVLSTSDINTKYLDVSYADISPTQKMDIYLPNEGKGPFPLIIAVHGGGFYYGSKDIGFMVSAMVDGVNHGYAVATINYRLSGEAKFPAAIYDTKAAIRFLRANAEKYNINPDKIALWGGSAGGNLVSLAGVTGGKNVLYDDTMENSDISDEVTAVVNWFGVIDSLKMQEQFTENNTKTDIPMNDPQSFMSLYLGKPINEVPELSDAANPEKYITPDVPAFLIQHGDKDTMVPLQQSIHFNEALKAVVGTERVEFDIMKGAAHAGPEFRDKKNRERVFLFLDKYMK